MSFQYTGSVEIDIEVHDGALSVRVTDAQAGMTRFPIGDLSGYAETRDYLVEEVESEISLEAAEMARSLVRDLFDRVVSGSEATS